MVVEDYVNKALISGLVTLMLSLPAAAAPQFAHIIIIVQENRTPDNLFSACGIPGADVEENGIATTLAGSGDPSHTHTTFVNELAGKYPKTATQYVEASTIQPYCQLAVEYGFANRMFQTNQGPSTPAHQFLFSATSQPENGSSLFESEEAQGGCIENKTVIFINPEGQENTTGSACLNPTTVADLLVAANYSWRYYAPTKDSAWNSPVAINHLCQSNGKVCNAKDWTQNDVTDPAQILTDVANGNLASVSWVIPAQSYSDHPGVNNNGGGPAWVSSIVNAVGATSYWQNTAILVTWDDWGGFYDHVSPTPNNTGFCVSYCYGFRVPLLVISAQTPAGYVDNNVHDFGSVVHFIESNFGLGTLGNADYYADDLSEFFESDAPREYKFIDPQGTFDRDDRGDPDDY